MKINYCNIFILVSWLGLSACSQDNYVENNPTNKEEITFNYALDSHNELSRAYTSEGYHTGATEMSDLKGILVCVRNGHSEAPEALKAQKWYPYSGTPNIIYWDDVSNNEHDVRKDAKVNIWAAKLAGREKGSSSGQVNVSDAGTLTWTINADQKTNGIDNNDLLAADYQSGYKASTAQVPLCFHHAMTKITVNIKEKDENSGFANGEITHNPSVTLIAPNTKATVNLTNKATGTGDETGFLTECGKESTPLNVQMHKTTTADGYSVSFDAIVAPGNTITPGTNIATITITDQNGKTNSYYLNATAALITAWGGTASSVTLKYGVNYIVNVKLSKQEITFDAKVVPWDKKTGEGEAKINFIANVISSSTTTGTDITTNGAAFTLWRSETNKEDDYNASYDENSSTTAIDPATTCTYSSSTSNWSNSPIIYWPNGSTNYYFRALTKYNGSNYVAFTGEDYNHDSKTDLMVYEGTDLLWGTTAAHTGTKEDGSTQGYAKGAAINPRTSTVPMEFEHIMSKVTINLETTNDAAKVDLSEAKVTFYNYSIGGKVSLVNGDLCSSSIITEGAGYSATGPDNVTGNSTTVINGGLFLPQQLNRANFITKLIITLKDGTTYSLNLKDCTTLKTAAKDDTPAVYKNVTEWLHGMHYTYTIHLEKEKITFRALVKEWEEATGSGNATLDWD